MHEIDRSFRARKVEAEERHARTVRHRVVTASVATVLIAAAGGGAFLTRQYWLPKLGQIEQIAAPEQPAPAPPKQIVVASTNVDLPGDPLIIRLGDSAEANSKVHETPVTDELEQPALPDNVAILSDIMLSSSERIMALPSSPEDFAFFQSQSARAKPLTSLTPASDQQTGPDQAADDAAVDDPDADQVLVPLAGQDDAEGATNEQAVEPEAPVVEDGIPTDITGGQPQDQGGEIGTADEDVGAGWGETLDQGQAALPDFKKTAIEDTTTVQTVTPEVERFRQTEDYTVSIKGERPLEAVIAEYGFSADDAKAATDAAKRLFTGFESLGDRSVVGLRGYRAGPKPSPLVLMQVSINPQGKYLGTVARTDDGNFVSGVDPWFNEDLSQYANGENASEPQKSYRLLDAIYSTSTRNNVPSSVTGEAIMLISRSFDLQALATKSDRLILAYAKDKDSGGAGRVLYVAVRGVDRDFECFVYQPQPNADYACMTEKDATHSITVTNDMVTPVNGVLTSTFGPRMHPILHQVRIHKGVDWAAPVGTPIVAAFDGKIALAGDGKGYGNVIRIDHGGGKATAYAHMSRFEKGIAVGVQVRAGDTIGYVGTTGLSTGPHLHFELYMNGAAVDPLGSAVAEASGPAAEDLVGGAAVAAGSDGSAVELLVNHIVHVESGGNARAKNPLSSAAGLGQFIKSTWLRMMRTYRPELFKSMSEAEILELRYDPTMARQMVGNLARENEARLRAYGHSITAGRLYLAHFLGPEGAHQALAAPANALVVNVMGAAVISANPFLTGKDCAYVVAWAEKKMSGRAPSYVSGPSGPTSKTVVQTSPEFIAYKGAVLKLVELAIGTVAAPADQPAAGQANGTGDKADDGKGAGGAGDKGGAQPAAIGGTEEE